MPSDAELSEFGLGCCRRCRRILLTAHLEKGRCQPGNDCAAAAMIRAAWEDGHPDALLFAKAVERGLLEAAVSEAGLSDGGAGGGGELRADDLTGRQ